MKYTIWKMSLATLLLLSYTGVVTASSYGYNYSSGWSTDSLPARCTQIVRDINKTRLLSQRSNEKKYSYCNTLTRVNFVKKLTNKLNSAPEFLGRENPSWITDIVGVLKSEPDMIDMLLNGTKRSTPGFQLVSIFGYEHPASDMPSSGFVSGIIKDKSSTNYETKYRFFSLYVYNDGEQKYYIHTAPVPLNSDILAAFQTRGVIDEKTLDSTLGREFANNFFASYNPRLSSGLREFWELTKSSYQEHTY